MTEKTPRPPFTAEDLELLATPNEQLKKKVDAFSFDTERFNGRIETGERWQRLLQAHLYFDHVLTLILLDALTNPEAINARRIGFYQKLQLISAMNLLPSDLVVAIDFINGLRNKIAHELDFEIPDQSVTDLSNCTPKYLRDIVERDAERQPGPLGFHELLRVILFQIEILRQGHAFERLATRKAMLRLQSVLDKRDVIYRE